MKMKKVVFGALAAMMVMGSVWFTAPAKAMGDTQDGFDPNTEPGEYIVMVSSDGVGTAKIANEATEEIEASVPYSVVDFYLKDVTHTGNTTKIDGGLHNLTDMHIENVHDFELIVDDSKGNTVINLESTPGKTQLTGLLPGNYMDLGYSIPRLANNPTFLKDSYGNIERGYRFHYTATPCEGYGCDYCKAHAADNNWNLKYPKPTKLTMPSSGLAIGTSFDPLTQPGTYRVVWTKGSQSPVTYKMVDGKAVAAVRSSAAGFSFHRLTDVTKSGEKVDGLISTGDFINYSKNLHIRDINNFYFNLYEPNGTFATSFLDKEPQLLGTTLYAILPRNLIGSDKEIADVANPSKFTHNALFEKDTNAITDWAFEYVATKCDGAGCKTCAAYRSMNGPTPSVLPTIPSTPNTPSGSTAVTPPPSKSSSTPSYSNPTPYSPGIESVTPEPTPKQLKKVDCSYCTAGRCRFCGGTGEFADSACWECKGTGSCKHCLGTGSVLE